MCRAAKFLGLAGLLVLGACQSSGVRQLPERTEVGIGGPERVFSRPVAEIVPLLQGARRAGPNGRAGPELVFWGYELAGNRPAT